MSIEIAISNEGDYLYVEYSGEYQGDLATLQLEKIQQACRQYGCSKLLVDIRNCTLTVTFVDKFLFGEEVAKRFVLPIRIRIAMLVTPEQYDTFVKIIAENRGASYEIFTDKNEALKWLLG